MPRKLSSNFCIVKNLALDFQTEFRPDRSVAKF